MLPRTFYALWLSKHFNFLCTLTFYAGCGPGFPCTVIHCKMCMATAGCVKSAFQCIVHAPLKVLLPCLQWVMLRYSWGLHFSVHNLTTPSKRLWAPLDPPQRPKFQPSAYCVTSLFKPLCRLLLPLNLSLFWILSQERDLDHAGGLWQGQKLTWPWHQQGPPSLTPLTSLPLTVHYTLKTMMMRRHRCCRDL